VYTTDFPALGRGRVGGARGLPHHVHTIQNWSNNVYNLVTQTARAEAEGPRRVDRRQTSGHAFTMKYPSVYLNGPQGLRRGPLGRLRGARPAPKMLGPRMATPHPEPLDIVSKSNLEGTGDHHYRGLSTVDEGAKGARFLRPLRRAAPRRAVHLRDGSPTWRWASRDARHRATRRGVPRWATTSSST